jgi:hypothetical protein
MRIAAPVAQPAVLGRWSVPLAVALAVALAALLVAQPAPPALPRASVAAHLGSAYRVGALREATTPRAYWARSSRRGSDERCRTLGRPRSGPRRAPADA